MEHFLEELLQELLDWLIKIASILFQIEGSSDLKLFYQWNIFPWYFLSEFHLKIINSCSIQAAKLVSSPQRPKWGGLVVMSTCLFITQFEKYRGSRYWGLKLNSKIDFSLNVYHDKCVVTSWPLYWHTVQSVVSGNNTEKVNKLFSHVSVYSTVGNPMDKTQSSHFWYWCWGKVFSLGQWAN